MCCSMLFLNLNAIKPRKLKAFKSHGESCLAATRCERVILWDWFLMVFECLRCMMYCGVYIYMCVCVFTVRCFVFPNQLEVSVHLFEALGRKSPTTSGCCQTDGSSTATATACSVLPSTDTERAISYFVMFHCCSGSRDCKCVEHCLEEICDL